MNQYILSDHKNITPTTEKERKKYFWKGKELSDSTEKRMKDGSSQAVEKLIKGSLTRNFPNCYIQKANIKKIPNIL